MKKPITIILLLFVAASIVFLGIKEFASKPVARSGNDVQGSKVIAYYFHGKVRCPTCQSIESYAHEAVSEGFADQINSGRLQWRVLNYEEPQNQSLVRQYEVVAPTVVLVRLEGGKQARWENLSDVWGLTGSKADFLEYIRENVRSFLAEGGGKAKQAG